MRMLNPTTPHATVDPATFCEAHEGLWPPGVTHVPGEAESRRWRATTDLTDSESRRWTLAAGTLLRQDAERGQFFVEGPRPEDAYWIIDRRFCVLDGPLAGTCWETGDLIYAEDHSWNDVYSAFSGDEVRPTSRYEE